MSRHQWDPVPCTVHYISDTIYKHGYITVTCNAIHHRPGEHASKSHQGRSFRIPLSLLSFGQLGTTRLSRLVYRAAFRRDNSRIRCRYIHRCESFHENRVLRPIFEEASRSVSSCWDRERCHGISHECLISRPSLIRWRVKRFAAPVALKEISAVVRSGRHGLQKLWGPSARRPSTNGTLLSQRGVRLCMSSFNFFSHATCGCISASCRNPLIPNSERKSPGEHAQL